MTILSSLMMLSMTIVQITMSSASAKRVMEVLNEKASIGNPDGGGKKEVTSGAIAFYHVSFSYTDVQGSSASDEANRRTKEKTFALNDVSLRIHAGETVGIIGGTGSGKSTLAMLVARLYDVTSGSVMVDGMDVRDYAVHVLRSAVCVVLQDGRLFSGTVLDNLRWGNEHATRVECIRACQLACADEFVSQMPQGYDSLIEQNGANLSGGQRQRLCLARALLRRPKILILDDSTSACDTVTDARIRKNLREESPETTKLIVAQRMESVRDADRIIVMESGQVVGFDTHERLLASNTVYQEIARTQHQGE
jgi:ATP-binding cassette subfamily B protein